MQAVATRRYDLDDCEAIDTLYRVGVDQYRLKLTIKDHPTEPAEKWEDRNAVQAQQWLNSAPEQLETASAVVLEFRRT